MEPNLAFQTVMEDCGILTAPPTRADRYDVPLDISKFTDIIKLQGTENYEQWHDSIHNEFHSQGVWDLVTGSEQPLLALNPPLAQTYKNWQRLDKSLSALLGMTVDRAILVNIPENISIDAMYEFLRTNYQPKSGPDFSQLLKTLSRLRLANFPCVSDYAAKFSAIHLEMELARPYTVSPVVVNTLFLEGLGPDWEGFRHYMVEEKSAINELHPLDLDELMAETQDYEDSFAEDEPTSQVTKKWGNRPFCGHCNMLGHHQEGCWRMEGRTEEEIKIIRRTLRQDRGRRRPRKTADSLANRITRPSTARRGAANRIGKFQSRNSRAR
ncbi:hypothetical protein N7478_007634 [Penicillium angulare]|uniref:uncharacterized protein n=1 Tax=Penicillium angulare TaxID=116970 RepID=UPI0025412915|nr:uncharacterized protein N7478_007634 [Penicillium angulare]KAJ5272509.1 hypothetical protein N7478_007634 [Penicillium angulare]